MPATGVGGVDASPKAHSPPPTPSNQGVAFIDGGREVHAGTAQSSLTVILELDIGGLISVILFILSTVSLQFHDHYFFFSLRPFLRIVAAYFLVTVWSSCS